MNFYSEPLCPAIQVGNKKRTPAFTENKTAIETPIRRIPLIVTVSSPFLLALEILHSLL